MGITPERKRGIRRAEDLTGGGRLRREPVPWCERRGKVTKTRKEGREGREGRQGSKKGKIIEGWRLYALII